MKRADRLLGFFQIGFQRGNTLTFEIDGFFRLGQQLYRGLVIQLADRCGADRIQFVGQRMIRGLRFVQFVLQFFQAHMVVLRMIDRFGMTAELLHELVMEIPADKTGDQRATTQIREDFEN